MSTTPALTAEQRAEGIVRGLLSLPHIDEAAALKAGVALIAQAIREAEDAAYERAENIIAREAQSYEYCASGWPVDCVARAAIEDIRALKSQEPA